jgi:hypothetical protein
MSEDPTVVRSVAVTTDDVVAAVEARHDGRPAVLRVTPPFAARMRARIHLDTEPYETTPEPLHVDPTDLLDEDAPARPEPDETEERLRADPDETYTTERHHELHTAAVAAWREAVRDHVVETVTLETPSGPHEVAVRTLG